VSFAKSDVHELLSAPPSCRLPRGLEILDVADACRKAAIELVTITDTSQRAVAEWRDGLYGSLVTIIEPAPPRAPLRAYEVIEMPAFARAYVLGVIRGMAREPHDVAFTVAAMQDGWIERCCDSFGRPGWVPVDRPNMRLSERVLSLVAADYLVRPDEWRNGALVRAA
jgi:hypothetical protein